MDAQILSKVTEFYSKYPARKWDDGQLLVQAQDDPAGVYFIESGSVRQYTIDYRGEEVVVNIFHDTAFFPMSWALNDTRNDYYFETTEDSTLRCAPKEEVLQFIQDNPDVALDLLHRLYSGIDGILMRMVHLMSSSAYVRVMHELVIHAKRLKLGNSEKITLPIKEYVLGTYCGLTRETVSREFRKLKKLGLVTVERNEITIVDLKKLEAELAKQV